MMQGALIFNILTGKAWKTLNFITRTLKKRNNNTKCLAYTALVRPILVYGVVCWDPYREGYVSALNRVQQRAAKFANNVSDSGWETSAQQRSIAQICALLQAYTRKRAWKAIGYRLLNPCYLSRDDYNQKIRTRKQRTIVAKYSFVSRTIKIWIKLPAGLLASFPCKLNTFRKMVKNVVTRKRIQVEIECT